MLQANANDLSLTSPEQGGPVLTARAFAIVGAALYDAYNSIERIGDPYLVTAPRALGADSGAAVAQAAHDASGHSTLGAAAFQTLARFYGRDDIRFAFTSDEFNGITVGSDGQVRPVVSRTYDSLTEAKLENAQSRIHLGIHRAFDRDEGIRSGDAVADYVIDNLLQPGRRRADSGGGQTRQATFRAAASAAGTLEDRGGGVPVKASGRTAHVTTPRRESDSRGGPRTPQTVGFRSIDGTGNNLANPDWGAAGTDLLRIAPAAYADGVSAPAGADRPSAGSSATPSPTRATRTSSATGDCRR